MQRESSAIAGSCRNAAVIGAGIGGLAAAIALRKAGWQVRVYERAASPRELGFALLLAPNAMAALEELGVAEAVRAAGTSATRFEIRHTDGRLLRQFRTQPGGRLVVALRQVLHGALLSAVGPEHLVLGRGVTGLALRSDDAELSLDDGSRVGCEAVVGADGVGSVVRVHLHPSEAPPRSSGFVALRGVAYGVGDQLGDLAAVGYLGSGVEAATARAGNDAVYWYLSLLASDLTGVPPQPRVVVDRVTAGFDPRFRAIAAATADADLRLEELYARPPLRSWGRGHATLLGDAAHPVLPHTGQGAAQALEDAVALGLAARKHETVEDAFRAYENVRMPRTRRLIAAGPRIAHMTTTRNPVRIAVRTALILAIPEFLLALGIPGGAKDPHRRLRCE